VTVVETSSLGVYRAVMQQKPRDLLGKAPPPVHDAFAVNLNPLESDTRRATVEELVTRYEGLLRTAGGAAEAAATVKAKAGEIATPLLAMALACLLIEVLLVQRIGRRRRS
jgi:hypothetical protein